MRARAVRTTVWVSSTRRPSATQPAPRFGHARTAHACWRPHAGWEWGRTDGVSRGSRLAVYAEGGSSQVCTRASQKTGPIAWIPGRRRLRGAKRYPQVSAPNRSERVGRAANRGRGRGRSDGANRQRSGSAGRRDAPRRRDEPEVPQLQYVLQAVEGTISPTGTMPPILPGRTPMATRQAQLCGRRSQLRKRDCFFSRRGGGAPRWDGGAAHWKGRAGRRLEDGAHREAAAQGDGGAVAGQPLRVPAPR
jgi:hypothetical protein